MSDVLFYLFIFSVNNSNISGTCSSLNKNRWRIDYTRFELHATSIPMTMKRNGWLHFNQHKRVSSKNQIRHFTAHGITDHWTAFKSVISHRERVPIDFTIGPE